VPTHLTYTHTDFNDEELGIRETALKFAKEEIIPKTAHYDKTGEYPWDIFKKAHALGLVNTEIPVSVRPRSVSNTS